MRWFALTTLALGLVVAAAGSAVADHLSKSPGTWKMVSAERDGKALPKEDFDKDVTMTIKAEGKMLKIVVKKGDEVVTEATAKLAKESDKHDQYDITYTKGTHKGKSLAGQTRHGIISVEGDTLRVCWHGEKGYPKEFTGAKDSHCTLRVYQRVKE